MNRDAITIVGERLCDLEAALDRVEPAVEANGYVTMTGYLPEHLSLGSKRVMTIDTTRRRENNESVATGAGDNP